ncbi:hypothetical protein [Pseudomonas aeruginosa]|uniref:SLOG domain-containing protein n=1 Tax=Pseudomonas aeruginosa TaxID=287 RepID=UPI0022DE3157|nr:hypothetical protein [Pseudomonas aeruginosa]
MGATAAALVDLSTVAGNKISNPPWVKFQSAGWVNFPSAPTEHELFRQFHPAAKVLPVPSPGGAALNLAKDQGYFADADLGDVDFAQLFHTHLALNIQGAAS